MALLRVVHGERPGEQLEITGEQTVLGRHPDCDLVLDAAAVSRQHARIVHEGEQYYVEDLHSRNGTYVNGQLIQGRQPLRDGDRLKICDLVFNFHSRHAGELRTLPLHEDPESSFVIVDEEEMPSSSSTIMSKVDVASSVSGLRMTVNPEVKLRAMIEIAQSLSKVLSVDDVLPKLLDSLFKIFLQADRGFIILAAIPGGPLIPKAVKHRRAHLAETARVSRTIVHKAMESQQAILSADAGSDQRFDTSQSIAELRIRSVMCVPLVNSERQSIGAIQIDTVDQHHRFGPDDLEVLASVAAQASIALDNARMHENALRQLSLQRDLELAHKVQRGLLPGAPPRLGGYQFFDYYEPANQVGGDYYDYIELPEGRLGVVVADVSGKGVAAALLMAKLSSEVRFCLAMEPSTAEAVNRINSIFCRSGWDDRFVTFVLAVLDSQRHELSVVNAGHMPPLVRSAAGGVEPVGAVEAGLPLGVSVDARYDTHVRALSPGDCLAMFTDGISEAMNPEGETYGLPRLQEAMQPAAANVPLFGRQILDDVKRFVSGRPQSDDICLVCLGRGA
jgi:serine phosphatase RsbU (regulator of sigma subunit)